MSWQTRTGRLAAPARALGSGRLPALAAWLRASLFREPSPARVTWRQVVAAFLLLAAGTAASLARTSGPGPGTNYRGSPIPLSIPDMGVHEALIWGACAIVVAVVGIALGKLTAPHWPLAVTALAFSILMFVGEIIDNWPIVQPRYVIAPALLLYTAIVAMLRPRGLTDGTRGGMPSDGASAGAVLRRPWSVIAAWTPVTVFTLLLATAVGFNYRVVNTRSESPPWTAVVATARHACMRPGVADYKYSHPWWSVRIPCSRV